MDLDFDADSDSEAMFADMMVAQEGEENSDRIAISDYLARVVFHMHDLVGRDEVGFSLRRASADDEQIRVVKQLIEHMGIAQLLQIKRLLSRAWSPDRGSSSYPFGLRMLAFVEQLYAEKKKKAERLYSKVKTTVLTTARGIDLPYERYEHVLSEVDDLIQMELKMHHSLGQVAIFLYLKRIGRNATYEDVLHRWGTVKSAEEKRMWHAAADVRDLKQAEDALSGMPQNYTDAWRAMIKRKKKYETLQKEPKLGVYKQTVVDNSEQLAFASRIAETLGGCKNLSYEILSRKATDTENKCNPCTSKSESFEEQSDASAYKAYRMLLGFFKTFAHLQKDDLVSRYFEDRAKKLLKVRDLCEKNKLDTIGAVAQSPWFSGITVTQRAETMNKMLNEEHMSTRIKRGVQSLVSRTVSMKKLFDEKAYSKLGSSGMLFENVLRYHEHIVLQEKEKSSDTATYEVTSLDGHKPIKYTLELKKDTKEWRPTLNGTVSDGKFITDADFEFHIKREPKFIIQNFDQYQDTLTKTMEALESYASRQESKPELCKQMCSLHRRDPRGCNSIPGCAFGRRNDEGVLSSLYSRIEGDTCLPKQQVKPVSNKIKNNAVKHRDVDFARKLKDVIDAASQHPTVRNFETAGMLHSLLPNPNAS